MVEKGGKDFPAVLTLASSAVQKNYKAGFYQILPGMVRGEYILSGYFSGSMTALWIVMNAGTKPFRLWLNKNKFEKSEKEGWYRFTVKICVNVPPENGKGLLAIETFTSSAGQKTSFAEIRLDSQRD